MTTTSGCHVECLASDDPVEHPCGDVVGPRQVFGAAGGADPAEGAEAEGEDVATGQKLFYSSFSSCSVASLRYCTVVYPMMSCT